MELKIGGVVIVKVGSEEKEGTIKAISEDGRYIVQVNGFANICEESVIRKKEDR